MRWYVLLLFFLLFLYSTNSQGDEVCMQQGGECKSTCDANERILDLNEQCVGENVCCISNVQSLNRPGTSSTCSDRTPYSSCSDFFSGGLGKPNYCDNGELIPLCEVCGCSEGYACSNGVCLAEEGGTESYDISLVNSPPIVSQIPIFNTPFDSVELNSFSEDPEGSILSFTFLGGLKEYNSNVLRCSISGSAFSCTPIGSGTSNVVVIVSDGEKTTDMVFSIVSSKVEKGENRPPVADAGNDMTVFIGQEVVLDGSLSYDLDGNLPSLDDAYTWRERGIIIGKGKVLKTKFTRAGRHIIELEVKDSGGVVAKDRIDVKVTEKNNCVRSDASYFPRDTICTKKWPSGEGERIAINSISNSCDLFEVCDEGLDYIVEEAIDCCDGSPLLGPKKVASCDYANRNSGGDVSMCKALYITKGFGDGAIYMQDYFYSEMCCYGVREICPSTYPLYTPRPLPLTDTGLGAIGCRTTADNRILGEWLSDTRIDLNNIALQDVHTGASVNVLSTGTCVDYNSAVVTMLRKLGIKSTNVFLVEASNHAYALVKFPGDRKYTIVDTTGNSDPITLGGLPPQNYPYCENMLNCYNDNGRAICPELMDIKGCEGVEESIIKQGSRAGLEIKNIGEDIFNKLAREAKR